MATLVSMLPGIFKRRWFRVCGAVCITALMAFNVYHRAHPLVFGESFFSHQRCLKQATASLVIYATDHGGAFPYHTNGFGDALLLVDHAWLPSFTGPGYSTAPFERARATGQDVPEDQCGRIYIQGLSETNDARIAIIFDRHPSPGDHTHGFARISASPVREVGFRDGSMQIVPVSDWLGFVAQQVELLVAAGFTRDFAQSYYGE